MSLNGLRKVLNDVLEIVVFSLVYILPAFMPVLSYIFLIICFFTKFHYVPICYAIFRIANCNTIHRGGWSARYQIFRRLFPFHIFRNYFPASLVIVDESQFDNHESYILLLHPHGLLPTGLFANFISKEFETQVGLVVKPLILPYIMQLPFIHEAGLSVGLSAASKENFEHLIKLKGKTYASHS